VQTTGISLVRENTEALKPPRFLWTSFPLGRPLGKPNDPAFQRRVILAALDLLRRPSGPVLEDYPEDAPSDPAPAGEADAGEGLFCPVDFSQPKGEPGTWSSRLASELALMRPWYELSLKRRGRTTFGVARAPVEVLAEQLGAAADGRQEAVADLILLKRTLEDLKAYWLEAMTAQPGDYPPNRINRLLWRETELGRAMLVVHAAFHGSNDPMHQAFSRALAPRYALED
jgi:D-proline reductase (dithiol) PrdB